MKKFIGVLALFVMLFAFSGPCFATGDSAVGDVDFGIHIGTGTSQQYSGDVNGIDVTFSKERTNMAGVYLNFSGPDSCVELQPELNYVRDKVNNSRFDYMQMPVLIKMNSPEFRNGIKVFSGIGPYGSVLLSDDKDAIRRYDYGYILSAGVTVKDTISFELRHSEGLMNVSSVDGLTARNSKNMILMGFNF